MRAVLVGIAGGVARLEAERSEAEERREAGRGSEEEKREAEQVNGAAGTQQVMEEESTQREGTPDISAMMGGLSISQHTPPPNRPSEFVYLPDVVVPEGVMDHGKRGKVLRNHKALQYVHSETPDYSPFPPLGSTSVATPNSTYLPALLRWCLEAPEKVKRGECEIPRKGDGTEEGERWALNVNDLYLGPGSVDAIEGCVSREAFGAAGKEVLIFLVCRC